MSRPYQFSDREDKIRSPLDRQPQNPYPPGQQPSFAQNVNRKKTKKWVEAKTTNYDGDDWGDYDEDDEYGVEAAASASPKQVTNARSFTGPVPPSAQSGPRRNSFDAGDERRAFSSSAYPAGGSQAAPADQNPLFQSNPVHPGPPRSPVGPLHVETSVNPGNNQQSASSSNYTTTGEPRQISSASFAPSNTSETSTNPEHRRDFSPSALPTPLQARGSPISGTANQSPVSRFPPRKSSISSIDQPGAPQPLPAAPPASAKSPTSPLSPSKARPFIRPADIYKRMEEEREKERRSMDSQRQSTDSGRGDMAGQTSPGAARADGSGVLGRLAEGNETQPPRASLAPVPEQPKSAESKQTAAPMSSSSGLGPLPQIGDGSDFGSEFWDSTPLSGSNGKQPAVTLPRVDPTSQDGSLQHQPSLGFRSMVHQAFDAPAISSTHGSLHSQATDSTFSRSNTSGTSDISPIISRNPSTAAGTGRSGEIGRETTPVIPEEPSEQHHSRSVSGDTMKAHVEPGYRRDFSTPERNNSPARTPIVEGSAPFPSAETAQLAMTSPDVPKATPAPTSTAAKLAQDGSLASHNPDVPEYTSKNIARSESPSKGRVADLAGKFNEPASAQSVELNHSPSRPSSSSGVQTAEAQPSALERPTAEREISFRPKLPGGFESYASTAPATPMASKGITEEVDPTMVQPEPTSPEEVDLTPTAKHQKGDKTGPMAALTAAGVAMGAAFRKSMGSEDAQPESPKSATRSYGDIFHRPLAPDRMESTMSTASTIPPTPPAKDEDEDIPPPVPLKQRSMSPEPPNMAVLQPPRPLMTSELSTDSRPSDYESDRLRREIVRSLSPEGDHKVQASAPLPANSRAPNRESSAIPSEYDSYWATGGSDEKQVAPVEHASQGLPEVTATSGPMINEPAPLAEPSLSKTSSTSPGMLNRKFSWEKSEAPTPAAVAAPDPLVAAASPGSPPQSPPTGLQPHRAGTLSLNPKLSGEPLHIVNAEPGELPTPVSPTLGEEIAPPFTQPQTEEFTPASPTNDSEIISHPAGPRPQSGARPQTGDVDQRPANFREILAIKSTPARIAKYNETREQFAKQDTGLDKWLSHTLTANPEYRDLANQSYRPTAVPTGFSAPKHKATASIGRVFTKTDSPVGSSSQTQARPTTAEHTGPAGEQRASAGKGKDILKTAGVLGGKGMKEAKGLFAKGKSKFRSSGTEKATSPTSTSNRRASTFSAFSVRTNSSPPQTASSSSSVRSRPQSQYHSSSLSRPQSHQRRQSTIGIYRTTTEEQEEQDKSRPTSSKSKRSSRSFSPFRRFSRPKSVVIPNKEDGIPDIPDLGARGRDDGRSKSRPLSYPVAKPGSGMWPEPDSDFEHFMSGGGGSEALQQRSIAGNEAGLPQQHQQPQARWSVSGISGMFDKPREETRPLTPPPSQSFNEQLRLGVLPSPARSAFAKDVGGSGERTPQDEMLESVIRHSTPPAAPTFAPTIPQDEERTPTQAAFGEVYRTGPEPGAVNETHSELHGLLAPRAPNRLSGHQRAVSLIQPEDVTPNAGNMEEPVSPISPEDGKEGFPTSEDVKPVQHTDTKLSELDRERGLGSEKSGRPLSGYSHASSSDTWEKVSHPKIEKEARPTTSGASAVSVKDLSVKDFTTVAGAGPGSTASRPATSGVSIKEPVVAADSMTNSSLKGKERAMSPPPPPPPSYQNYGHAHKPSETSSFQIAPSLQGHSRDPSAASAIIDEAEIVRVAAASRPASQYQTNSTPIFNASNGANPLTSSKSPDERRGSLFGGRPTEQPDRLLEMAEAQRKVREALAQFDVQDPHDLNTTENAGRNYDETMSVKSRRSFAGSIAPSFGRQSIGGRDEGTVRDVLQMSTPESTASSPPRPRSGSRSVDTGPPMPMPGDFPASPPIPGSFVPSPPRQRPASKSTGESVRRESTSLPQHQRTRSTSRGIGENARKDGSPPRFHQVPTLPVKGANRDRPEERGVPPVPEPTTAAKLPDFGGVSMRPGRAITPKARESQIFSPPPLPPLETTENSSGDQKTGIWGSSSSAPSPPERTSTPQTPNKRASLMATFTSAISSVLPQARSSEPALPEQAPEEPAPEEPAPPTMIVTEPEPKAEDKQENTFAEPAPSKEPLGPSLSVSARSMPSISSMGQEDTATTDPSPVPDVPAVSPVKSSFETREYNPPDPNKERPMSFVPLPRDPSGLPQQEQISTSRHPIDQDVIDVVQAPLASQVQQSSRPREPLPPGAPRRRSRHLSLAMSDTADLYDEPSPKQPKPIPQRQLSLERPQEHETLAVHQPSGAPQRELSQHKSIGAQSSGAQSEVSTVDSQPQPQNPPQVSSQQPHLPTFHPNAALQPYQDGRAQSLNQGSMGPPPIPLQQKLPTMGPLPVDPTAGAKPGKKSGGVLSKFKGRSTSTPVSDVQSGPALPLKPQYMTPPEMLRNQSLTSSVASQDAVPGKDKKKRASNLFAGFKRPGSAGADSARTGTSGEASSMKVQPIESRQHLQAPGGGAYPIPPTPKADPRMMQQLKVKDKDKTPQRATTHTGEQPSKKKRFSALGSLFGRSGTTGHTPKPNKLNKEPPKTTVLHRVPDNPNPSAFAAMQQYRQPPAGKHQQEQKQRQTIPQEQVGSPPPLGGYYAPGNVGDVPPGSAFGHGHGAAGFAAIAAQQPLEGSTNSEASNNPRDKRSGSGSSTHWHFGRNSSASSGDGLSPQVSFPDGRFRNDSNPSVSPISVRRDSSPGGQPQQYARGPRNSGIRMGSISETGYPGQHQERPWALTLPGADEDDKDITRQEIFHAASARWQRGPDGLVYAIPQDQPSPVTPRQGQYGTPPGQTPVSPNPPVSPRPAGNPQGTPQNPVYSYLSTGIQSPSQNSRPHIIDQYQVTPPPRSASAVDSHIMDQYQPPPLRSASVVDSQRTVIPPLPQVPIPIRQPQPQRITTPVQSAQNDNPPPPDPRLSPSYRSTGGGGPLVLKDPSGPAPPPKIPLPGLVTVSTTTTTTSSTTDSAYPTALPASATHFNSKNFSPVSAPSQPSSTSAYSPHPSRIDSSSPLPPTPPLKDTPRLPSPPTLIIPSGGPVGGGNIIGPMSAGGNYTQGQSNPNKSISPGPMYQGPVSAGGAMGSSTRSMQNAIQQQRNARQGTVEGSAEDEPVMKAVSYPGDEWQPRWDID